MTLTPKGWMRLGVGLAFALALSWGFRVDFLRAGYKHRLDTITIVFSDIGRPVKEYADLPVAVHKLDIDRRKMKEQRDEAQGVVDIQSRSIRNLEAETAEAKRQAEQRRKQIAEVTRERERWIKIAKAAQTRTERLSAEEETKQCDEMLNRLYQRGF